MKVNRIIHGVLLVLGLSVVGLLFYYALWLLTDEEMREALENQLSPHFKDKVATVKRWLDS